MPAWILHKAIFSFILLALYPAFAQTHTEAFERMQIAIISMDHAALKTIEAQADFRQRIDAKDLGMLFQQAAARSSGAVIETLLDLGADIEAADRRGYTPLMLALEAGNAEAAYILKIRGASLSAQADDGTTPEYLALIPGLSGFDSPAQSRAPTLEQAEADAMLLLAAELGDTETVRLALAAGADPAARAGNKWSAMMLAALGSNQETLGLIIAALNAQAPDGAFDDSERSFKETSLDPMQAAIIGQGGEKPDHERVLATTRFIIDHLYRGKDRPMRPALWAKTAHELGYSTPSLYAGFEGGDVLSSDPEEFLAMVAEFQASRSESKTPPLPHGFLPKLEYELPVGSASDRDGWASVREILARDGLFNGAGDEVSDDMLWALAGYLNPLVPVIRARAMEAAQRAGEEGKLDPNPRAEIRYDEWNRKQPAATYIGEMYFPNGAEPRPVGYAVETRSGRPSSFDYYGPQGKLDDPLCELSQVGKSAQNNTLTCKLLDGSILLHEAPDSIRITFKKGETDIASAALGR